MPAGHMPDFENMNETDVREEIVRPLISRLGYRHGTEAYVQTEVRLSYGAAFLGRKDPKKDPLLQGRPDYVCGVVAAGRWIIEVKAPGAGIGRETVQQAHTYAAHPEIAAYFFIVTSGKLFRLFETGSLDKPLLEWSFAELDEVFLKVSNTLGVDAIRKRARLVVVDPSEPLGHGLDSRLEILNGSVIYDTNDAGRLKQMMSSLEGLEVPVAGGDVSRDSDGRIHARISIASVSPLVRMMGAVDFGDHYDFYSSDKHISTDKENPSIFQNSFTKVTQRGTSASFLGAPSVMAFGIEFSAFTEVIGFVSEDRFQGTVRIEADLTIGQMDPMSLLIAKNMFGVVPGKHHIDQSGRFSARLGSGLKIR